MWSKISCCAGGSGGTSAEPDAVAASGSAPCLRACCNAPIGEPELHADDLAELLHYLGWERIVCFGRSSGARLSLFLALRHPHLVTAIVALDITAGGVASFVLSDVYYDQYAQAVVSGGMAAVVKKPLYAASCRAHPAVKSELLALDPEHFRETMIRFRDFIARSAEYPVIGLTASQLSCVSCPVLVLRTFPDDGDAMHTLAAAQSLARSVACPMGTVVEPDQMRWLPVVCDFLAHCTAGTAHSFRITDRYAARREGDGDADKITATGKL